MNTAEFTGDGIPPEEWDHPAEQSFARRQADLAAQFDLDIAARTVETRAGTIHYIDAGNPDGTPVLLLHGISTTAATWLPLVPAIADDYRVLIPDRPGRGLSDAPSYRGRHLRSFLVEYLCDLLDDQGIETPHVVGNSLGGLQAFFLCLDHDRVDRLGLVGGPGGVSREFSMLWRLMTVTGVNRILFWLLSRGDPMENAKTAAEQFLVTDSSAIPEEFYAVMAAAEDLPGRQASLQSLTTEEGSFGRMHEFFNIRDEIVTIDRPTAFIWGTDDSFWPPSVGKPLADQMANAEFHVLEGHGHMPWMEPGDETAATLRAFLDG